MMELGFQLGVVNGLLGKEGRQQQPGDGYTDTQVERLRTQCIHGSNVARDPGREPNCEVAGKLVQPKRQASSLRPD